MSEAATEPSLAKAVIPPHKGNPFAAEIIGAELQQIYQVDFPVVLRETGAAIRPPTLTRFTCCVPMQIRAGRCLFYLLEHQGIPCYRGCAKFSLS